MAIGAFICMIEIERVWTKHVDGYICCGFGVFPDTDGWEVWHYHEGEWRPFEPLQLLATFEAAKSAALIEVAKITHAPSAFVSGGLSET